MKVSEYKIENGIVKGPLVKLLDVGVREGVPILWALTDAEKEVKEVEIKFCWVGQQVEKDWKFLRIFQDDMGTVWAVFWKVTPI